MLREVPVLVSQCLYTGKLVGGADLGLAVQDKWQYSPKRHPVVGGSDMYRYLDGSNPSCRKKDLITLV